MVDRARRDGPDPEVLFAHLAVRGGAVPESVAREALSSVRERSAHGETVRLVEVLLRESKIAPEAARTILARQGEVLRRLQGIVRGQGDDEEGALARGLSAGLFGTAELQRALEIQVSGGPGSLGEILVSRGILSARELARLRRGGSRVTTHREEGSGAGRLGKFEVLGRLGQGGMGTVYRVREEGTGRTLALKVLSVRAAEEPEAVARFEREARALARLRHPNLVELLEAGEIEGAPYYTMPVVEGRPLSELLKERGALPAREAVSILLPLAQAVAAVHEAGLVHRDLKPSNVLVDPSGRPVLIDFGIARSLGESTRWTGSGQRLGTPAYMSPERIRGDRAGDDPAGDVWALGVMLFEALAGTHPFEARSSAELLTKIAYADAAPIVRAARGDARLAAILARALAPAPARRYPAAAPLAEDLGRFLGGANPAAPPVSAGSRTGRLLRRHAFAASLALAAAAVLSAAAMLSRLRAESFEAERRERADWIREERKRAANAGEIDRLPALDRALATLGSSASTPPLPALDPERQPQAAANALATPEFAGALASWRESLAVRATLAFEPALDPEGRRADRPYRIVLSSPGTARHSAGPGDRVVLLPGRAYHLTFAGHGLVDYELDLPPYDPGADVKIAPVAIDLASAAPGATVVAEYDPTANRIVVRDLPPPADARPDPAPNLRERAQEIAAERARVNEDARAEASRLAVHGPVLFAARRAVFRAYTLAARNWRSALTGGSLAGLSGAAKELQDALAAVSLPEAGTLDAAKAEFDAARALAGEMASCPDALRAALAGFQGEITLANGESLPDVTVRSVMGDEVVVSIAKGPSRKSVRVDWARVIESRLDDRKGLLAVRGEGEVPGPGGVARPGKSLALYLSGAGEVLTSAQVDDKSLYIVRGDALTADEVKQKGLLLRGRTAI
ncbi:MAG: serine/threonine protein kinase, partial [Planctomycetes bacterium]|nr:serine/threonine protein kinase [Planctomycetota bacterium]